MGSALFLIVSLVSLTLLLVSFLGIIYIMSSKAPTTIRLNMDEVPPVLSRFWWMVSFFQYYVVSYLPSALLARRQKLLYSAGLEFFLTTEETYALQCLSATMFFLLTAFLGVTSGIAFYLTCMLSVGTALLGWFYPLLWLMEQKKKRVLKILKSMPAFLDILTLCCECGLTMNSGLTNYCEKGPKGPLRSEMERALRDMKSGATRVEALSKLAVRMSNPDMTMFVSIVAQCEKLGVPLGDALRRFSEQKRTERFQRAEKLAMEAPMKIIGPLVIFIFPITFIIIAFPIAISLMENLR
jgi:tight adherence protein C